MSQPTIGFGPLKGPDTIGQLLAAGGTGGATSMVTVATGALPTVTGRNVGDLHFVQTGTDSHRLYTGYVLQGAPAPTFTEAFNRVDSETIGNGWRQDGGDTEIVSQRLRITTPDTSLTRPWGNGDLDLSAVVAASDPCSAGVLAYSGAPSGLAAGYAFRLRYGATTENLSLRKDGAVLLTGHLGVEGVAIAAYAAHTLLLQVRGSVITCSVDGVQYLYYDDPFDRPTGIYAGVLNSDDVGATAYFDDVHLASLGTLGWRLLEPALLDGGAP